MSEKAPQNQHNIFHLVLPKLIIGPCYGDGTDTGTTMLMIANEYIKDVIMEI